MSARADDFDRYDHNFDHEDGDDYDEASDVDDAEVWWASFSAEVVVASAEAVFFAEEAVVV